jgi:hypothetical protein
MRHLEDIEQTMFFNVLRYKRPNVYDVTFHVPNGGQRNIREGARLKQQGVKPGVPDIFVPVACGNYLGLFIEMKRKKVAGCAMPVVSKEQKHMMRLLEAQGYRCIVAYGADEALDLLEQYLKGMITD